MPGTGLDLRPLTAIPQQIVEALRAGIDPARAQPLHRALHGVQSDRADLHLLGRARRHELPALDARRQVRVVGEHALAPQHVGHEVVGEDRELAEIAELPPPAAVERGREIRRRQLRALV